MTQPPKTEHVVWHPHKVTPEQRWALNGHHPAAVWFTGLSGSGKSTLANEVEHLLVTRRRAHTFLLDGDNLRLGLNAGLGFDEAGRQENVRRAAQAARLFHDAGLIVLAALISPFATGRAEAKALFPPGRFFEVYVRCPQEECERRDPKGLHKQARAGQLEHFTGIAQPYQPPAHPDLVLDTTQGTPETLAQQVVALLERAGILSGSTTHGKFPRDSS
ncbi:MAG: adenylyl-sulfate kinase [Deltaproteobacteria bacterium]|nr:adenylyl-sulfate kinase [Deltaproteobacteria bacterium]